jgi:adenylate cyclase class 1
MSFFSNIINKIKSLFARKEKSELEIRLDEFFDREQNYKAYNDDKLNNILSHLPQKKREVFSLIPALLYLNDRSLPGYVFSRTAMQGISHFNLSQADKRLITKYFKKTSIKVPEAKHPAVELLALIGSIGSVSQTESSDFDFWVCTSFDNFTPEQLSHFRNKLSEIEKWAHKAASLEVHFFLMDIKHVYQNNFGESGGESSGTALSKLLKEEFYRSATYVCGKLPYWCIIPPDANDETYAENVEFLKEYSHFSKKNYLDIGNVYSISKSEFFGAALWEIVKGWQYPFKSILKMALLEKYLSTDLTSELLCNRLKAGVFKHPHDVRNDPYILLFDRILSFYKGGKNSKDLEMIKTSFYVKSNLKGSEIIKARSINDINDERTKRYFKILKDYLKDFNWDMETHKHLESFSDWTVKETNSFISKIDNSMLNIYKRIMQSIKLGGSIIISDTDLTIIGRKIQSIFRKVPNKIPFIAAVQNMGNIGSIVLHQEQKDKWDLYFGTKRVLNPILAAKDIVYSGKNIFEIIGWITLNKYYKSSIYIFIKSSYSNHNTNELKTILNYLQSSFFTLDISSIPSKDLLQKEKIRSLYLIPNYSEEISSSVNSLNIFYLNSWGEFFYKRFDGSDGITPTVSFFNHMIANTHFDYNLFKNNMNVYVPKKVVGIHTSANKKLHNMLFEMSEVLRMNREEDVFSRYITIIDDKVSVFYLNNERIKLSYFKDLYSLYNFFEMPTLKKKVITRVDGLKDLRFFRVMCLRAKYGQVNVMLSPTKKDKRDIIIIDEVGNINYYDTVKNSELPYSLAHLKSFIQNTVHKNITTDTGSPFYKYSDIPIKFYQITTEDNKFYALDSTKAVNQQIKSLDLMPTQLKVKKGRTKNSGDGYIIHLDDDIFDSSDYPDILGELMQRIAKLRGSKKDYGIFITELSLDSGYKKKFCPTFSSLSHYLIYKQILENKLKL